MGENKKFRQNLTTLLASRGLNPTEFASQTNIPRATIQKLLNGTTENPRNATLSIIASFFNVPIKNLLYGEILKTNPIVKLVPVLKRSEVEKWLNDIDRNQMLSKAAQLAIAREVSENSFAISCNEIGNSIFKSGSQLIFDPKIKPTDDSYVLIKLFDHSELLFRQVSIDIGVTFIKPISVQFGSASKVRVNDKIIATLIQVQTNFEEA